MIIRSDREQVMAYWRDRGIVTESEEPQAQQYIEHGTMDGGQEAADRLAKIFARYRVQLVGEPLQPAEGSGACEVCQEPLFRCPSGLVCKNGHGF